MYKPNEIMLPCDGCWTSYTEMERLHDIIRNLERENRHLRAKVQQLRYALSRQVSFKSNYCGVDTA